MLSTESIETLTTASDLPARLAAALADARRSAGVSGRMSPELSYGRHGGPPPATARRAAVMLLVFQRGGRWHVPVTERPAALRHGGQISLPGGTVDLGETSEQAAVRELREELGFESPVVILGQLADCYVYASNFVITPWLAATDVEPEWRPSAAEVARVVELPLDALLDPGAVGQTRIARGPLVFHAPCYSLGEHCIWGATSVILSELADVLRGLL